MTTKRRTKSVSSSVIICTILTTPQRTKRCAEHLPAGALNEALKLRIFAMPMFTVPESSPGKLNRLHAGAYCFKNAAGRRPVLRQCAQLQRCGHHELAQPSRFTRRWENQSGSACALRRLSCGQHTRTAQKARVRHAAPRRTKRNSALSAAAFSKLHGTVPQDGSCGR